MNQLHCMQPPPITYDLWVTPTFVIHATGKVPHRLHRWMMSKAFGFRFVVRSESTL